MIIQIATAKFGRRFLDTISRVSMGLTVSRKTAKNLAVRRKNERILTVSREKMLTVKNLTTK